MQDEAAKIVSIGTGADMVSRFALAGLSLFLTLKARYIFLAGAVALICVRFGMISVCRIVINHNVSNVVVSLSIFVRVQFRWNAGDNGGHRFVFTFVDLIES